MPRAPSTITMPRRASPSGIAPQSWSRPRGPSRPRHVRSAGGRRSARRRKATTKDRLSSAGGFAWVWVASPLGDDQNILDQKVGFHATYPLSTRDFPQQPSGDPIATHGKPWLAGKLSSSSTAQGSGRSFKHMKPSGAVSCCDACKAEQIQGWTKDGWNVKLSICLSFFRRSICLSIYHLFSFSVSDSDLPVCQPIYLPIYLSTDLPDYLYLYKYLSVCLSAYLSISLSIYLSIYLSI